MFHTYILRSDKSGRYYVGHTQEISLRLVRHNTGQVHSTRGKGPWTIVYEEEYPTKLLANRRELEIKRMKSKVYIEKLINSKNNDLQ